MSVPQGQPTAAAGAPSSSLAPRMLKGNQADYIPATYEGKNTSGMLPLGACVLVRMDTCGDKTQGGIDLPDDIIERNDLASTTGVIYAVGPEAWPKHQGAEPGERVWVDKYAGAVQRGKDGNMYRIMEYACVAAKIDPESLRDVED